MDGNFGPGQAVDPRVANMQTQQIANAGYNSFPGNNPNMLPNQNFNQQGYNPNAQIDFNQLTPEQQAALINQMQQMGQIGNQMAGGPMQFDQGMPGQQIEQQQMAPEMYAPQVGEMETQLETTPGEQAEMMYVSPEMQQALGEANSARMELEGNAPELGVVENIQSGVNSYAEEQVDYTSTEKGLRAKDIDGVEPELEKAIDQIKSETDLSKAKRSRDKLMRDTLEQRYGRVFGGRN